MIKKYINILFSVIQKYISPDRPFLLILIAFTINVIWAFSMQFLYGTFNPDKLYYLFGDGADYVAMSESFYKTGSWLFNGAPTDYRMPGYLFIYLPFRLFLDQNSALNAIIIFQLVLSAVAKVFLAKFAYSFSKNFNVFIFTFLLINITDLLTELNLILYTESVASSLLILFVYSAHKLYETRRNKWLYISSCLFLIIFFLRPFMGVLLPMMAFILYKIYHKEVKLYIKSVILFSSLFIVFEAGWVIRNFLQFNKIEFFESSVNQGFKSAVNPYSVRSKLVANYGGNKVSWQSNSAGTWFTEEETLVKWNVARPSDDIFPNSLFSDGLTIDTLKLARFYDWKSKEEGLDPDSSKWYNDNSIKIYQKFIDTYKKNNKFQYYIGARIVHFYDLLYQPYSSAKFKSLSYPLNILVVFANSFFCLFIFFFGMANLPFFLVYQNNAFKYIVAFIPVFLFVFCAIVLKTSEVRTVVLSFPFLCILSAIGIADAYSKSIFKLKILIFAIISVCVFLSFNYMLTIIKA